MSKLPLPGSHCAAPPGTCIGRPPPEQRLTVSLVLRPRSSQGERFPQRPAGPRLSRAEFAALHGADPDGVALVEAFAKDHGLTVDTVSIPRRMVELSGTVAALATAFNVTLELYEHSGRVFHVQTGPTHLPPKLVPLVQGVMGLDARPLPFQAQTLLPLDPAPPEVGIEDITFVYNFPEEATGTGQNIAILSFDAGFLDSDMKLFFDRLGLAVPTIVEKLLVGAVIGVSDELTLDLEIAGASAPSATLVVYHTSREVGDFHQAISRAINDLDPPIDIFSISFTIPEGHELVTPNDRQIIDGMFQDARDLGITVLVAAGDQGATNGVNEFRESTDAAGNSILVPVLSVGFPASCPHATACGGTRMSIQPDNSVTEVVWNDGPLRATGGGVSEFFPIPRYQAAAGVIPLSGNTGLPGRGVPDVAGHAARYEIALEGRFQSRFGTSAVAPLWAGLVARINELTGRRLGFLNDLLYGRFGPRGALNDITTGHNEVVPGAPGAPQRFWDARPGWDPCTGWGTPDAFKIVGLLGPPTVSSVAPTAGPVAGGLLVTIRGSRFTGALTVLFGGLVAETVIVRDDEIVVLTPASPSDDSVHVGVLTSQGASAFSTNDQFKYFFPIPVVASMFPASGPVAGGTSLTLFGVGFSQAFAVNFVGPSGTFSVAAQTESDTQLTVVAPPARTPGTVNVTVSTPGSTSAPTSFDRFTYLPAPPARFLVLMDPAATAAEVAQAQEALQRADGIILQVIAPFLFLAEGTLPAQENLLAAKEVAGILPEELGLSLASAIAAGGDFLAIASLLAELRPGAEPPERLEDSGEVFGGDLTALDENFDPVPTALDLKA